MTARQALADEMTAFLHRLIGVSVPAIIPVALAILSLYLAVKAYRRKTGANVRGVFTACYSRACNDPYVAEVVLENVKDRAVTIFAIYLRLGYSYYVEIESFDDAPLILRPYETYRKAFGPIEFYSVNMNKIDLNSLFSPKINKRLFLSTSDGKHKVRSPVLRWSPVSEYFSNCLTAVIRPVRSIHKEHALGSNMKFVVDFVAENGKVETVPIHPEDWESKLFRDFNLTRESLESKESLEQYLHKQRAEGKLSFKDVVVYDLQSWRARGHDSYTGPTIKAEPYGLFHYYVLGKLYSMYENWRTKRANRKRIAEQQQQLSSPTAAAPNQSSNQISLIAAQEDRDGEGNPESHQP